MLLQRRISHDISNVFIANTMQDWENCVDLNGIVEFNRICVSYNLRMGGNSRILKVYSPIGVIRKNGLSYILRIHSIMTITPISRKWKISLCDQGLMMGISVANRRVEYW